MSDTLCHLNDRSYWFHWRGCHHNYYDQACTWSRRVWWSFRRWSNNDILCFIIQNNFDRRWKWEFFRASLPFCHGRFADLRERQVSFNCRWICLSISFFVYLICFPFLLWFGICVYMHASFLFCWFKSFLFRHDSSITSSSSFQFPFLLTHFLLCWPLISRWIERVLVVTNDGKVIMVSINVHIHILISPYLPLLTWYRGPWRDLTRWPIS